MGKDNEIDFIRQVWLVACPRVCVCVWEARVDEAFLGKSAKSQLLRLPLLTRINQACATPTAAHQRAINNVRL